MGRCYVILCLFVLIGSYLAPPVDKDEKEIHDSMFTIDQNITEAEAQEREYMRYISEVLGELDRDPFFPKKFQAASQDELTSGHFARHLAQVAKDVRDKLNNVKQKEIAYQEELVRQNKKYMMDKKENSWNPIHDENKDTFEIEDLRKLLMKHKDLLEEQSHKRRDDFKKYEMKKEHKRRKKMKKMTDEGRAAEMEKMQNGNVKKQHEKLHEPGHKAQIEEVWEKQDGLDPESFDMKTFFNLHDKNSDGYLDRYEMQTIFLTDLDKVYNESDPNVDEKERKEEMEEMWEHAIRDTDKNKDGLVSFEEFFKGAEKDDFKRDQEWKPLTEKEQFTPDELEQYEREREEREEQDEEEDEDY